MVYNALSDSDVEPTEGQRPPYVRPITTHKNPGNKESTFDKTLITDSPPQNSYSKSKISEGPITVLGNSMIKMIKPPKLSRSIGEKVNIKTFPGATIKRHEPLHTTHNEETTQTGDSTCRD
jgi:hypothetical protein